MSKRDLQGGRVPSPWNVDSDLLRRRDINHVHHHVHQLCLAKVGETFGLFCWDVCGMWMEMDGSGRGGVEGCSGRVVVWRMVVCSLPISWIQDVEMGGVLHKLPRITATTPGSVILPFSPTLELIGRADQRSSSSRTGTGKRHRTKESSNLSSRRLQRTMMLRSKLSETEIAGFCRMQPWGACSTSSLAQITQCVLQHRSTRAARHVSYRAAMSDAVVDSVIILYHTAYPANPCDGGSCRPEGCGFCAGVERLGCRGLGSRRESGTLATERLHFMMESTSLATGLGRTRRVDFQTRPSAYLQGGPRQGRRPASWILC